jgi:4-hydroxybenzoate polyprenyltransferase
MQKLMGYLRLMRPANIVTAISDILAGVAIVGFLTIDQFSLIPILLLICSTIGLYGGGVVMNDYFDADLDQKERPERPIPSGLIARSEALVLGVALLSFGIVMAAFVYYFNHQSISGIIALLIAVAALIYDTWGKHHTSFGPLNMGICRGLNLLLGMSISVEAMSQHISIAIIPVIYIAAITLISRGEVYGGRSISLYVASFLYLVAMSSIVYISSDNGFIMNTLLFVVVWAFLIFPPLQKAMARPEGRNFGRAVKSGVIALIAMNAAWAAAFGAFYGALVIIVLLPLSILLAKLFAVT